MVSSATAMEFCPGQLATNTPRWDAARTSMVFTPAPARTTSERACAAWKTSPVTCLLRTTRMWASRAAPGRSFTDTPGWWSTVSPRARKSSSRSFGNASATRIFMRPG